MQYYTSDTVKTVWRLYVLVYSEQGLKYISRVVQHVGILKYGRLVIKEIQYHLTDFLHSCIATHYV